MKLLLISIAAILLVASGAPVSLAESSPASSPQADQNTTAPEAPPAYLKPRPPRKPMPLAWKIAIVLSGLTISAVGLTIAARTWHTFNLFDRQYRFVRSTKPARRFGGLRSGGCMASMQFHHDSGSEDS